MARRMNNPAPIEASMISVTNGWSNRRWESISEAAGWNDPLSVLPGSVIGVLL